MKRPNYNIPIRIPTIDINEKNNYIYEHKNNFIVDESNMTFNQSKKCILFSVDGKSMHYSNDNNDITSHYNTPNNQSYLYLKNIYTNIPFSNIHNVVFICNNIIQSTGSDELHNFFKKYIYCDYTPFDSEENKIYLPCLKTPIPLCNFEIFFHLKEHIDDKYYVRYEVYESTNKYDEFLILQWRYIMSGDYSSPQNSVDDIIIHNKGSHDYVDVNGIRFDLDVVIDNFGVYKTDSPVDFSETNIKPSSFIDVIVLGYVIEINLLST